jgi:hypothetical protein
MVMPQWVAERAVCRTPVPGMQMALGFFICWSLWESFSLWTFTPEEFKSFTYYDLKKCVNLYCSLKYIVFKRIFWDVSSLTGFTAFGCYRYFWFVCTNKLIWRLDEYFSPYLQSECLRFTVNILRVMSTHSKDLGKILFFSFRINI